MVMPLSAVTLFKTRPRFGSASRMAAPEVVVAKPVANPWIERATIRAIAELAVTNKTIAAIFKSSAAAIAGRRPI